MPPEQQQDNVWISREEYERLRQAQQATSAQPVIYGQTDYPVDEPAKVKPIQITIGAILAVGLFLSLTVPFLKFISAPILLIMLIFAVMSFNDFRRAKRQTNSSAQAMNSAAVANQGKGSGKYHALLVVLLCILAAPVVFIGGIIILLIFATHGSGGQSS